MALPEPQVLVADIRSVSSLRLSVVLTGGAKKPATGFIVKHEDAFHLCSNWHVFSGRDYQTGQCISADGAIPESIELTYLTRGETSLGQVEATIRLLDDDRDALWRQHPDRGQAVDIATIHLPWKDSDEPPVDLPSWDRELPETPRPGDDVYIVGFPRGLSLTGGLAIWKRASIATEPAYPIQGVAKFLVDTATREGMSGSPVFVKQDFVASRTPNLSVARLSTDLFLLGVYSGRYGADGDGRDDTELEIFKAQLGIVFHRSYLVDILGSGRPGSFALLGQEQSV